MIRLADYIWHCSPDGESGVKFRDGQKRALALVKAEIVSRNISA